MGHRTRTERSDDLDVEVYAPRYIPAAVRREVIARDGMNCRRCSRPVVRRSSREPYQPDTLHLDHLEHWASAGPDTADNLIVSCADCNLRRPKPKVVSRQSRVKVEFRHRERDYYWPDGYVPPVVSDASGRDLMQIRGVAARLGETPARIIRLVTSGHLAATATSPIRVEIPAVLRAARDDAETRRAQLRALERVERDRQRREDEARARRAFNPRKGLDPERVAAWRGVVTAGRELRRKAGESL